MSVIGWKCSPGVPFRAACIRRRMRVAGFFGVLEARYLEAFE
jgi:hypothetical protein